MKKIKKLMIAVLMCCLFLTACGNSGVSQEEYDRVAEERDRYKNKYEELLDDYAREQAQAKINEIENNSSKKERTQEIKETEEEQKEMALEDMEGEIYYNYSGSGDDVVTGLTSDNGYSVAHIKHNGTGYFSVKGHYDDSYDLLASTTDPYDGFTLIYPNKEYTFEVTAKGEWEIEITSMGISSVDEFSGSGDFVTAIFAPTSETYEVSSSGTGYFAIKGWTDKGRDLLVSTTDDDYNGKVMFNNKGEYAFFEITAEREWEIKPVK